MNDRNRELIRECIKVLGNRSVYLEPDWAFSTSVKKQSYKVKSDNTATVIEQYKQNDGFEIYYISDIHLEYHLYNEICKSESEVLISGLVRGYVQHLFSSDLIDAIVNKRKYLIIFAGDIASSPKIAYLFYSIFMGLYKFYQGIQGRVYCVLGNHEYCNCPSVSHLFELYSNFAKRIGIRLLQGDNCYCYNFGKRVSVIGATGFAGYNEMEYNKNSGLYVLLSRKDEIAQTVVWERQYNQFLRSLQENSVDYGIVITHYPIIDWISSSYPGLRYGIDQKHLVRRLDVLCKPRVIYICGHTHLNFQYKNFFCDNQIGYYSDKIQFKRIDINFSTGKKRTVGV